MKTFGTSELSLRQDENRTQEAMRRGSARVPRREADFDLVVNYGIAEATAALRATPAALFVREGLIVARFAAPERPARPLGLLLVTEHRRRVDAHCPNNWR